MIYPSQRPIRRPRSPARRLPRRVLTTVLAALVLGACASRPVQVPAPSQAGAEPVSPSVQDRSDDSLRPPKPQWRATGKPRGGRDTAKDRVPIADDAPGFTPFSQDLAGLRAEVSMICGSTRASKRKGALASLVADLYLSGVDPALGTEALILADCAPVASIVREMVAQGGDEVVDAVVERAFALSGPGTERSIETAASAGLALNLGVMAPTPSIAPVAPASGDSHVFGMSYFPSRAESPVLETAKTVETLYSHATPGYGIYTFVLLGAGFDPRVKADVSRYAELLRVIETYVLSGDRGAPGPSRGSHAFLVAVQPGRGDAPLVEQTGPKLSEPMRADLAGYLRQQGQPVLAQRLVDRPGPFLISSLEPRLMPSDGVAPRLIVDLSAVGPEYMYTLVDAYDQPVPIELSGRPESLSPIRERLLGLFNQPVAAGDLAPALTDAWVFRLGGPVLGDATRTAGPGASLGAPLATGAPDSAPTGNGGSTTAPQTAVSTTAADSGPQTLPGTQPQTKNPSEKPTP